MTQTTWDFTFTSCIFSINQHIVPQKLLLSFPHLVPASPPNFSATSWLLHLFIIIPLLCLSAGTSTHTLTDKLRNSQWCSHSIQVIFLRRFHVPLLDHRLLLTADTWVSENIIVFTVLYEGHWLWPLVSTVFSFSQRKLSLHFYNWVTSYSWAY